jgi:TetR/AcrR family transcriptional regulator, mexJK operon transcriptional repressor
LLPAWSAALGAAVDRQGRSSSGGRGPDNLQESGIRAHKVCQLPRNVLSTGMTVKGKRKGRGRGRPRRDEVEDIDRRLLARALDYFLDMGYEATTINAITASLGMSKQTIYLRYRDKLSLFKAALQRAIDNWLVPLTHLQELEGDDLEQTLIDVSRLIVTTLMSPEGLRLIRITNAESYRMPEIGESTYRQGHEFIARYLADLFRRRIPAAKRASGVDLDDLATTFLNLLSGPARLTAWGLSTNEINVDEFVRRRVQIFLNGIMPRNSASGRQRKR